MSNVTKLAERETGAVPSVPHVLVAINAVMDEIAQTGIAKDRSNQQQNYKFRGIDDVYNALAPLLSKHRLIIKPRGLSRACEERQTKNGGTLFYVTVAMEFDLISAEDGSRETAGPFYGEAMDSADKATNKAQSAAFKYMAMQQFCIPTEGDNDADGTTHEPAPRGRAPSAADTAINLLRGCGSAELFKEAWAKNFQGWKEVLSEADYKRVLTVKTDLVNRFVREAEEAKAREKPAEDFRRQDPFDDEIPF